MNKKSNYTFKKILTVTTSLFTGFALAGTLINGTVVANAEEKVNNFAENKLMTKYKLIDAITGKILGVGETKGTFVGLNPTANIPYLKGYFSVNATTSETETAEYVYLVKNEPAIEKNYTAQYSELKTNWVKTGNDWIYLDAQGNMVKNQWVSGEYGWYYLDTRGIVLKNTWTPDGYYVDQYGVWIKEKTKIQTGWVKEGNFWNYKNSQGQNVRSQWVGDYYLKVDGKMAASEWVYDNNYKAYYYLDGSGAYVKNAWQGDYYLKADGKMAASEWVYDNNYKAYYYVDGSGAYVKNAWQGNYYLKADGKMAVSEWIYDNNYKAYYYLDASGAYVRNAWQGNYYLGADGKMLVNTRTPDGYYVDGSGAWIRNASNALVTDHTYGKARGNSKTLIFHMPGDRDYDEMKTSENLVVFENASEAIKNGYRRAKR